MNTVIKIKPKFFLQFPMAKGNKINKRKKKWHFSFYYYFENWVLNMNDHSHRTHNPNEQSLEYFKILNDEMTQTAIESDQVFIFLLFFSYY